MKDRVGLQGLLLMLAFAAVFLVAGASYVRRVPAREEGDTHDKERSAGASAKVTRASPGEENRREEPPEPEQRPSSALVPARRDEKQPRREPYISPSRAAAPNARVPAPQPVPPSEIQQGNERREGRGALGYGEPSGYSGRAFHGGHDRWRLDRFRGSWNFLIFPGPVVSAPVPAYAGPGRVAGVYVGYSGDDVTGSSFAAALSDQLRQNDMASVSAGNASLELYVISMDEDPSDAGYGSAVSVSYVLLPENRFITAQLLDVGNEQVGPLAASVVSYAAELLDEYR
jgi:hypothetical protein